MTGPSASDASMADTSAPPPRSRSCRNCGAVPGSHYCGECGQRVYEARLTMPTLWARLLGETLNLDRGFFFTAWQLTVRPAGVVSDYLDGRTVRYTSPVRYLVVVAALTTLGLFISGTTSRYQVPTDIPGREISAVAHAFLTHFNLLMERYYNLLTIAAAPFMAMGSYLLFRSARRTFAEHLIFNAYTYAHATLLFTGAILGLAWAVGPDLLLLPLMLGWSAYWAWAAVRFFDVGVWSGIVRSVVAGLLGTSVYWGAVLAGILAYVTVTAG